MNRTEAIATTTSMLAKYGPHCPEGQALRIVLAEVERLQTERNEARAVARRHVPPGDQWLIDRDTVTKWGPA